MAISSRLICHPAAPCADITALQVSAEASADGCLQLRFELRGAIHALRIPAATGAGFADELWKHTCFEAFVSADDAAAYREFNFSPSGQWAAYAFTDYRQRDTGWHAAQAPRMIVAQDAGSVTLQAMIPASALPVAKSVMHIGLTAVTESADATLSYWALKHIAERPDFHPRASFTLRLACPEQT